MREYCTIDDVMNLLLLEVDSGFESQITSWIKSSTKRIEMMTNRVFIADDTNQIKFYNGSGRNRIVVDDIFELDTVKVDDTEITDVQFNKGILHSDNEIFTLGFNNVEVTARFGYSENPPSDIVYACAFLTAQNVLISQKGNSSIKSEKIGNYSVTYVDGQDIDTVKEILNNYKKYVI